MKTVFIAGATGYLGRHLCEEYHQRGWYVMALVRNAERARGVTADQLIEAEATRPETLVGTMSGADLVISALGITRQADGLRYWDVDFQANVNLLREAEAAGVRRFAYIHVLNAGAMSDVPLVAAKAAFVEALADSPLRATVIAPSGYFSDMEDILAMAQAGRVWLFGDGGCRINPIHGADLACASAEAIAEGRDWLDVGGPDVLTLAEIAGLAFACVGARSRITYVPDLLRRAALRLLPWITPRKIHGPAQFFLSAMAQDMVGERHGTRRLKDHFADIINAERSLS
ncbi:SDR family oxidoreductase [Gymnodinialimonas ceratoperidinii]|uniref:SDR family oxidoreductase n=1 Tax=Gymnodinialimonas ceratoperidinii TaxID=2856823 RepID=A0A8F6TXB4_9RHOB|nr:SDR family oxidoreductase [Gymnodinialimonas ceratoperidinii]QXT40646.1 SDR family oxidoreductase [Gymnodinialimonas ceratoperidinii]